MHGATKQAHIGLAIAAAVAWTAGCRLPDEDDFNDPDGGFDAAVDDDAGPGAVCPDDAPDLFNNAYSPYVGGEEGVDLEVVDYSYFK